MMITLLETHLSKIHHDAMTYYPDECCGAILGRVTGDTKQVAELRSLVNDSEEDRRRRFKVTAEAYQQVETYADQNNLQLLGFYHSHPDHPPIPSETDKRYAWPFFSYIILSIENNIPQDCLSYIFDSHTKEFVRETINISKGGNK